MIMVFKCAEYIGLLPDTLCSFSRGVGLAVAWALRLLAKSALALAMLSLRSVSGSHHNNGFVELPEIWVHLAPGRPWIPGSAAVELGGTTFQVEAMRSIHTLCASVVWCIVLALLHFYIYCRALELCPSRLRLLPLFCVASWAALRRSRLACGRAVAFSSATWTTLSIAIGCIRRGCRAMETLHVLYSARMFDFRVLELRLRFLLFSSPRFHHCNVCFQVA